MGTFDDLIPEGAPKSAGAFDDLIPVKQQGVGEDVKRSLLYGSEVQLPKMAGQALQFFGADQAGNALIDLSKQNDTPDLHETEYGQSLTSPYSVRGNVYEAGTNAVPSIAPGLAGAGVGAAIGSVVPGFGTGVGALVGYGIGSIASLPMFYGSQAQDSYESVKKANLERGVDEATAESMARKAAHIEGSIEAGGELLADVIPFAKIAKPFARPVVKGAEGIVKAALVPTMKQAGKGLLAIEAGEVGTEMAQQSGEDYTRGQFGGGPGATWDETQKVIMPTALMSLIPGAAGTGAKHYQQSKALNTLTDPGSDQEVRIKTAMQAAHSIAGGDEDVARAFSLYAGNQIKNNAPIEIKDDQFYLDYADSIKQDGQQQGQTAPQENYSSPEQPNPSAPVTPPSDVIDTSGWVDSIKQDVSDIANMAPVLSDSQELADLAISEFDDVTARRDALLQEQQSAVAPAVDIVQSPIQNNAAAPSVSHETAPATPAPLHVFSNPDTGMESHVVAGRDGWFNVVQKDVDSGEFVPTVKKFDNEAAAVAYAKTISPQNPATGQAESPAPGAVVQPAAQPVAEQAPQAVPAVSAKKPSGKFNGNLINDIKQLGGVSQEFVRDITGESSVKNVKGGAFVFRKGGMNLDQLATSLRDHGYSIDTHSVDGGKQQLMDMLRDALDGHAVMTPAAIERAASEQAAKDHRANVVEQAKGRGINTVAKSTDKIEEELRALDARDAELAAQQSEQAQVLYEEFDAAIDASDGVSSNGMTDADIDKMFGLEATHEQGSAEIQAPATQEANGETASGTAGHSQGTTGHQAQEAPTQAGTGFALEGQTAAEVAAPKTEPAFIPPAEGFDTQPVEPESIRDAKGKAKTGDLFSQTEPKPSTNTVFTEDAAAAARAILKKKLSGQLNSGIDPEVLQAGLTLAGYHIEKGARSFTAYAKAMIEDMGDMVKPYLKSWYLGIRFDPRAAAFSGDMTSASEVEAHDVDTQDTDAAAHEAATSPDNNKPQPSEAQIKAGNYEKGHVTIAGLSIAIENPEGSTRSGTDANGKAWSRTMRHHYGYIKGTIGKDKDHIDVFVKPGTAADFSGPVFVVDQIKPGNGHFDEHKVMLGFDNIDQALIAYRANYDKDWNGAKTISTAPLSEFKDWLANGDTTHPFSAEQKQDVAGTKPGSITEKIVGNKLETNAPEITHLTKKGKTLHGVIAKTLNFGQAKNIDRFTMKKDGGFFIRMDHVTRPESTSAEPAIKPENVKPISSAANEMRKIGADAFKNGDPRLPPDFMAPASKKEWLAGWDAANVSAPVESASNAAPGTRVNGTVERVAADRLEKLYEIMQGQGFAMNSPEWSGMRAVKSVVDDLRKERTVVDVVGVLNTASNRLMRKHAPFAEVIDAVSETLESGKNEAQNESQGGTDHANTLQTKPVSEGTPGKTADHAGAGHRDSEPLGDGVAKDGQGVGGIRGVSGSTESTGAAGAGRADQAGEQSHGTTRDSGTVRPESNATRSEADFEIDDSDIGKGGLSKKYGDNLAAIRIIKAMEAEGRVATPEERKQIAKYVGWGALKGVFDPANKQWAKQHEELKDLLTDAEFKAARASTLDAHYTSPVAVKAMYAAMERMGFTGGRVLEPSVGVGNFFGMMPASMRNASTLHGVELDALTSRLVAALYPKAMIAQSTNFADYQIPAEYFDAVVGNPPFGSSPLVDDARSPYSGFSIHNYFLAKSIDKLRPGGIMQVVVSHNFLDAQDSRARKWIAERANLIGGARLPNTAFKENAGTEVVTDILIFQKKTSDDTSKGGMWTEVVDQVNHNPKTGESVTHKVNKFFTTYPDNVLGTPSAAGSMYGANEYTVESSGDMKTQLAAWVESLPKNIFSPINRRADKAVVDMEVPDGIKPGSYYVDAKGKIMQRGDDVMGNKTANEWTAPNLKAPLRMKGMIELRDSLRKQMRLERSPDATEQEIEANRSKMNAQYDAFLKDFGHINSQTNRRIFLDDTESQLLQALEFDFDKGIAKTTAEREGIEQKPPKAKKADIFNRRVLFPPNDSMTVSTAKDALLASLNYRGKVDQAYMAEVYHKPIDEIISELGDVVFDDPQAGIVTADEYLSGDVKTKLAEAKAAAKDDAKYKRNVDALEAVIPEDKKPSEISASIGASFVPAEIYEQFIKHISGGTATAYYIKATGQWTMAYDGGVEPALNSGKFGTSDLNAQNLFDLSMAGRGAVVKKIIKNMDGSTTTVLLEKETEAAREKQNAIKAEWQKWLWQDPARADRIASIYNEKMNRIVERKFDGDHMTFPGMNPGITLLAHQKNGVWRGLQSYRVLYDHVVGAGKAQPLDAKVLTPTGWKLMGDIAVGDHVVSVDGKPTLVEAVFPQGEKEIFRVEFSDGSATECCEEHLWLTQTYRERGLQQRAIKAGKNWPAASAKIRSLADIRGSLVADHRGAKNHSIPMVSPVSFERQDVPVSPYLMGVLLGDGGFSHDGVTITSIDSEIIDRCSALVPSGTKLGSIKTGERCPTWTITNIEFGSRTPNPMKQALDALGLRGLSSHEKFIPDCYLFNSVESRIELLRGLMDTDGSVQRHSSYFYTCSEQLADGVTFLVQSLGGTVSNRVKRPKFKHQSVEKEGRPCFVLCIKMPAEINPFGLTRKAAAVVPKTSYAPVRYITSVQSVGYKPAQCIRVAHSSHLYVTDDFIVTHNTFEMAALAMEMRRTGMARKPLFVVPNHLTLQWRSEFTRLYPGSNILAATPEDFGKGNRERMFSKIITGDWDAVVIGHSSLKKIGLPIETEKAVLQEQIDELAAAIEEMKRARGDKRIVSDMEKIRKNLEAKMKDKLASIGERDKVVTFDELGVDAMFIDEMHEFKNLTYNSTMDRNPGMGNPAGSAKAFDMFVKVRWLFDTFGDKTPFITATGTPVSNSLVEMFNMQRYMQYPTLKREGLHVFDAWAKQFGSVENVYEVAPSGSGYRQSTRFAKFNNLPALMGLYNTFADTVTLDDLKAQEEAQGKRFPVPKIQGGRPTIVVAKRSPLVSERMGIPRAEVDEYGAILFGADLSQGVEITQNEKSGKWNIMVGAANLGSADTEQDARLKVVQAAVSPKVTVDPESILGRFGRLKELTKQTKGKVNALSLTGEANKAGLDFRLINPAAPDFPGSKINLAVDNMMHIYRQWGKDKGTQLVFCDMSVPLSARASYASKARRLYVRDDLSSIAMKRGTLHAIEGHEDMPFFIVQRGDKEAKRFDAYDSVSGIKVFGDMRSRAEVMQHAEDMLGDTEQRQQWINWRESSGEITQDMIDEYNNENDVEADGVESFSMEDVAGVSGASKFSVYDDIKSKLVAKGIQENEVAFIHDYATPAAKDKLFKAVNDGSIRVLLGSTPKMGAGTNVQERLVALHHIDAPWRPSDLEQREGRIIRRGNELYERDPEGFEIFIGRYATEQTYDTRRWQILEHKARGIEQLRNYDGTINEIDDIEGEAANSADMKAAASGDPLILDETKLRNDVRRLEQLQAGHADEVLAMARRAQMAEGHATSYGPKKVAELQALIRATDRHKLDKDGYSPVTVDGKQAASKEAAQTAIEKTVSVVRAGLKESATIQYRGIEFKLHIKFGTVMFAESPTGDIGQWSGNEQFSPSGFMQRMVNYVARLPSLLESEQAAIEKSRKDAVALLEQSRQPFAQAKELDDAREAHKKVQRALMAKGPVVPDEQKADVERGIQEQKDKLEKLGFGDALREMFGSGSAKFSRTTESGTGMHKAIVEAMVKRVSAAWKNGPTIHVVQSVDELPKALRNEVYAQGAEGDMEGVFLPDSKIVYLVADHLDSNKHALQVLLHETKGHYGLRGLFGNGLSMVLNQIYASNAEVKTRADRLTKLYGYDKTLATEEALADLAGEGKAEKLKHWDRLVAFIRNALRKMGVVGTWTDADVRALLAQSGRFVERGTTGTRDSTTGTRAMSRADTRKQYQWRHVAQGSNGPVYVGNGFGLVTVSAVPFESDFDAGGFTSIKLMGHAARVTPGATPYHFAITDKRGIKVGHLVADVMNGEIVAIHDIEAYSKGSGIGTNVIAHIAANTESVGIKDIVSSAENYWDKIGVGYVDQDANGTLEWQGVKRYLDTKSKRQSRSESKDAGLSTDREGQGRSATSGIEVGAVSDEEAGQYRFSRKGQTLHQQAQIPGTAAPQQQTIQHQRGLGMQGGANGRNASFDSIEESRLDSLLYTLQDKHIDLKRVTQAIHKTGKQIGDSVNAYLQEELFHGRTASRVKQFLEMELDPLMKEMQARGVDMADFEEYLWMRHAEERNEQIAKVNPDMQDGGSGIDTQDAIDYLQNLSPENRANYEALAKRIDAINHNTRLTWVNYGLETQDTVDAMESAYAHYVPLMREDMDHAHGNGTGQGFSIKGKATKRATGSKRAVVDIIANMAQARERAIIRGEKNRVSTALIGLATLNPNPEFWKVDRPPTMRVVNDSTGLVEERVDPNYKNRDNVIVARVPNGHGKIIEHAVIFNERDPRALRMAKSLKNLDQDQIGEVLSTSAVITRYLSSINTQYNPIFGVVNLTRDAQTAMLNLSNTPLAGHQKAVLGHTISALRGIYADLRDHRKGKTPSSKWAALWEEFQSEGGQTGYRDMYKNARERAEALEKSMDPDWWQTTKVGKVLTIGGMLNAPEKLLADKAVRPLFDWLSDYNETMENSTRLAAYKVAKEQGMSNQQAASLAKNLTVNFNRKGEIGRQVGALYAFFNASVQGTARMADTLKGPAGKRILIGGLMLGAMQAMLLAAAGFGDDEPPDFVRDRALIIPLGDGKYITVPMPLGFNAIPSLGRIMTEFAMSGFRDPQQRIVHIIDMLMDVTNPIGNAGLSLQSITPTLIDPFSALAENKDWTGKPIARKDFDSTKPTPGFTRAKNTASAFSKWMAEAMNMLSGGTAYKPGAVSPSPDQIDYLIGQVTGGVGREYMKAEQFTSSMFTGEDIPTYKIPLVGRFYGTSKDQASQGSAYYRNLTEMNMHQAEIKGRRQHGEDVHGYLADNPEARLITLATAVENRVTKLRQAKRKLLEHDAPPEQIKEIDRRITETMKRLNDKVREMREAA